jgi:lipopolysaccharide/colanic/teichoic acid biosynthesis glycosyltransferase
VIAERIHKNFMQESTLPPYPPDAAGLPGAKYIVAKRIIDILLSALLLAIAIPIILICSALIRIITSEPPFDAQPRLGRFGRLFYLWKLRTTLRSDSASLAARAIGDNPAISSIGRVLRLTHLDGLPQLWNVLKGEMSLVGPRPEKPQYMPILEEAIPDYRQRLAIRPGITGLAQVCLSPGTGIPSIRKKIIHDLYYIRELGPLLDLRLLAVSLLASFGLRREIVRRLLPNPALPPRPPTAPVAECPPAIDTVSEPSLEDRFPSLAREPVAAAVRETAIDPESKKAKCAS